MKKAYKYLASEHFTKVFQNEAFVYLKASHPQNFNDPYELFLTVKTDGVNPEVLAYYQETVGEMPQWPTVCFSDRPDVVPMWAHYARECTGIVIEFDEDKILKAFPEARIEAVKYSSTPTTIDVDQIAYAYETSKPRHTWRLQNAAFNAAYFTKSKYWSYELERRLVVSDTDVITRNGLMTVEFPVDCVSAIIVGPKVKPRIAMTIEKFCRKARYGFYRMLVERSSMRSYFLDKEKQSFTFNEKELYNL